MTENLFNAQDPTVDPNKNYIEELVGEGKKFKSVEDLARGKFESDLYIKTLESRSDELRNDYLKLREENMAAASLRELVDQLTKERQQLASSDSTNNAKEDTKPAINPDELKSLVSNTVQEIELNKRQQENYKSVVAKLTEHFGDNYQSALKKHIEELDLTEDDVNRMARTNPKVLFRTLGIDRPTISQSFQSPPRSDRRSDNFISGSTKRTWSYYQKMKAENPKLYNDQKTTVQMHKDAVELGDSFFDTD
jgi:hypothetical protein